MKAALLLAVMGAIPAAGAECGSARRWTVRSGYTHEAYGFTGPGNGTAISLQDRAFHRWNAAAGVAYQHRFRLDDLELWAGGSRRLPWRRSHAGFTVGAATRHVLFPALRGAADGGFYLGHGVSADARLEYRHYDNAAVTLFSPALTWEGRDLEFSAGYSLSSADYASGGGSGGLSSYRARGAWAGWCRLKPWAGYARTHEPFEVGSGGGVKNFGADHYSAGTQLLVGGGLALNAAFRHEERRSLGTRVNYLDAGVSYSGGSLP